MNIKEIVLIVYLFFINIYKNIIDFFDFKNTKELDLDNCEEECCSHNDKQIEIEEIADEVIERILENYHLFKKED